jgi:hypothetical protein
MLTTHYSHLKYWFIFINNRGYFTHVHESIFPVPNPLLTDPHSSIIKEEIKEPFFKQPFLGQKHVRNVKREWNPLKAHLRSVISGAAYCPVILPMKPDHTITQNTLILKMEAAFSSQTLVSPYQTTWCHDPGVNYQNPICCHEKVHNMSYRKYVCSIILLTYITVWC